MRHPRGDKQGTAWRNGVVFKWTCNLLWLSGLSKDIDISRQTTAHGGSLSIYSFYRNLVFMQYLILTVLQINSVYQFRNDFPRLLDSLYIAFHVIAKIAMIIVFELNHDEMRKLIQETHLVYPNKTLRPHKINLKHVKILKVLGSFFIIAGLVVFVQWTVFPVFMTEQNVNHDHVTSPVFGTCYPFDANAHATARMLFNIYEAILLLVDYFVCFGIWGLLYSLVIHLCAGIDLMNEKVRGVGLAERKQPTFRRLSKKLKEKLRRMRAMNSVIEITGPKYRASYGVQFAVHIESKSMMKKGDNIVPLGGMRDSGVKGREVLAITQKVPKMVGEINNMLVERALVRCIQQHQEIIRFASELGRQFYLAVFIQMLLFRFAFSFLALQCVVSIGSNDYDRQVKYFSTFAAYVFMMYMFCWIGDLLTAKSHEISDAAYSCQWYVTSTKAKLYVRMLMVAAKNPLKLISGKTFSVNLHTLVKTVEISYSTFEFLRNVNEKSGASIPQQ